MILPAFIGPWVAAATAKGVAAVTVGATTAKAGGMASATVAAAAGAAEANKRSELPPGPRYAAVLQLLRVEAARFRQAADRQFELLRFSVPVDEIDDVQAVREGVQEVQATSEWATREFEAHTYIHTRSTYIHTEYIHAYRSFT